MRSAWTRVGWAWLAAFVASCSREPSLSPAESAIVGAWEAELPSSILDKLKGLGPQDYDGMKALVEITRYAYDFRADGTADRYVAGLGPADCSQAFRWRPLRESEETIEVELVDSTGAVHTTEFERLESDVLLEKARGPGRRLKRQKLRANGARRRARLTRRRLTHP
jgi:hypothetical protein